MDGVFAFLKPPGITSHDAVGICRRLLKEKRIGHSGTLDPLAYGVLPIFVGRATRLIEYAGNERKTYVAEGVFGYATDTEDSTGRVIDSVTSVQTPPDWAELQAVVAAFTGVQSQRPSKYSALKIGGRRAYERARAGEEFTLPEREITVHEITLLAYAYPYFTVRVTCSAGTYIRALLRDIAARIGIPATMTQLARTEVGAMTMADAVTAEELAQYGERVLQNADEAVAHLPSLTVSDEERRSLLQGKRLETPLANGSLITDGRLYRVYGQQGFFGIAKGDTTWLKVEKNIFLE